MRSLQIVWRSLILLAVAAPLLAQQVEPVDVFFEQHSSRPLDGPEGINRLFDVIPASQAKLISGITPTHPVLRPRMKRPSRGPDSVQALVDFYPEQPVRVVQRPARPTYGPEGVNTLVDVDPPEKAHLISGITPTRPVVKSRLPRPQKGPEGIDAMFETSTIDAEMDLLLGHGKILHLKQELTGPGVQPVVAIGDPAVVTFQMLNSRTLRLVAQRVGSTDLTILNHKNEWYVVKLNVVYDLEPLQQALRVVGADAVIEPAPWREGMIVRGQTRDILQTFNVIRTIDAYLQSIHAQQSGRRGGQSAPPAPPQPPAAPQPPTPATPK